MSAALVMMRYGSKGSGGMLSMDGIFDEKICLVSIWRPWGNPPTLGVGSDVFFSSHIFSDVDQGLFPYFHGIGERK